MAEPVLHFSLQDRALRVTERWVSNRLRVMLIGCGGTGSEMLDALVRLHFVLRQLGHPGMDLAVQDGDTVSPFNIGRQRFAPCDIGLNKAEILANRYGLAYGLNIRAYPFRALKQHLHYYDQIDLLVTCVDKASFRVKLADYWAMRRANTLWLDCGNDQMDGQCVLGHLGVVEGDRLPHVVDLFPGARHAVDNDAPSCSMEESIRSQLLFVNRWSATAAATLLVRLFNAGTIQEHGAFFNMKTMTLTPLAIDPQAWEFLRASAAPPISHKKGAAKAQPRRPSVRRV